MPYRTFSFYLEKKYKKELFDISEIFNLSASEIIRGQIKKELKDRKLKKIDRKFDKDDDLIVFTINLEEKVIDQLHNLSKEIDSPISGIIRELIIKLIGGKENICKIN